MIKTNILLKLLCYISIAAFCSCGKNDNPTPDGNIVDNSPKGTLFLHLHNYIDASEVDDYGITYTNTYDRKIKLTKGQFYLSNFEFLKTSSHSMLLKRRFSIAPFCQPLHCNLANPLHLHQKSSAI